MLCVPSVLQDMQEMLCTGHIKGAAMSDWTPPPFAPLQGPPNPPQLSTMGNNQLAH